MRPEHGDCRFAPVRMPHRQRLVPTACQIFTYLRDVGALTVELRHLSVVVLDFVQDDRAARGPIGLACDRVSVEDRLVTLIVDTVRQRRKRLQGQLALRFAGQFLLKPGEHLLDVLRAMRNLQSRIASEFPSSPSSASLMASCIMLLCRVAGSVPFRSCRGCSPDPSPRQYALDSGLWTRIATHGWELGAMACWWRQGLRTRGCGRRAADFDRDERPQVVQAPHNEKARIAARRSLDWNSCRYRQILLLLRFQSDLRRSELEKRVGIRPPRVPSRSVAMGTRRTGRLSPLRSVIEMVARSPGLTAARGLTLASGPAWLVAD